MYVSSSDTIAAAHAPRKAETGQAGHLVPLRPSSSHRCHHLAPDTCRVWKTAPYQSYFNILQRRGFSESFQNLSIHQSAYIPDLQILRLDVPLDPEGAAADAKASGKNINSGSMDEVDETHEELMDPAVQARDFLAKNPMAKILVVLDTHSMENGSFVWKGNTPPSYEGCSLQEVSLHLFQRIAYLHATRSSASVYRTWCSNTCPMRRERHGTATGASLSAWPVGHLSLRRPHARRCLQGTSTAVTLVQVCLPSHRHCADAVLSLSNHATVVSQVALPLVNFCTRWAQSPSGFDFLVASTMPTNWVEVHKPVLSTRTRGHTVYTKFSFAEPFGKIVLCHRMCTGQLRAKAGKTNTKITCMTCGSTCSVPKFTTDRTTTLGRESMVKFVYPQEQYPTEWKLPEPGSKFTQAVHPTTLPAQNSPVVTPSLENIQVPIPPAQEPPVTTLPVQMPPIATPPVQRSQAATRSSQKSRPVPPPVTKEPPSLSLVRAALQELSPPPALRTRSLPVASGSTPRVPASPHRLVIKLPALPLAHSKSTSDLPEPPATTPDPEASSVATRRKRSTTVTSSSSNPKRSKKSSSSGIR